MMLGATDGPKTTDAYFSSASRFPPHASIMRMVGGGGGGREVGSDTRIAVKKEREREPTPTTYYRTTTTTTSISSPLYFAAVHLLLHTRRHQPHN